MMRVVCYKTESLFPPPLQTEVENSLLNTYISLPGVNAGMQKSSISILLFQVAQHVALLYQVTLWPRGR